MKNYYKQNNIKADIETYDEKIYNGVNYER